MIRLMAAKIVSNSHSAGNEGQVSSTGAGMLSAGCAALAQELVVTLHAADCLVDFLD